VAERTKTEIRARLKQIAALHVEPLETLHHVLVTKKGVAPSTPTVNVEHLQAQLVELNKAVNDLASIVLDQV